MSESQKPEVDEVVGSLEHVQEGHTSSSNQENNNTNTNIYSEKQESTEVNSCSNTKNDQNTADSEQKSGGEAEVTTCTTSNNNSSSESIKKTSTPSKIRMTTIQETTSSIDFDIPQVNSTYDDEKKYKFLKKHSYFSKDYVDSDDEKTQSVMNAERKQQLLTAMRKSIPKVIRERAAQIDRNAAYATLCILDAFQGRLGNGLATNSKKSKFIFTIFQIQTSNWLLNLVVMSSVIHTLSIFFESYTDYLWLFRIIHVLVFLIQASDVALKAAYEGIWEYLDHDWQFLYAVTVSLHFLDLVVFQRTTLTNAFRPVVGLLRARSGRRFFTVVKKMIPSLSQSLAPLVAFLLILCVISHTFFSESVENASMSYLSYNWIWLILTTDSFARLFSENPQNMWYVVFFFTSLFIGQRFIVSVILGATFDTFTAFTAEQVKKEKLKEMQGLVKAFAALDDNKQGYITEQVWRACMNHLKPELSSEEISLYYEIASGGDQHGISVFQFMSLTDILSFHFQRKSRDAIHKSSVFIYEVLEARKNIVTFKFPENIVKFTTSIWSYMEKYRVLEIVNVVDITLFCLNLDPRLFYFLTPNRLITLFHMGEFFIHNAAKGGKTMETILSIQSSLVFPFIIGTIGGIALEIYVALFESSCSLLSYKLYVLLRFLRCSRLIYINKDLTAFLSAIVAVGPLFLQNMIFAFIVSYMFGMLGNVLFGRYSSHWESPVIAMITVQKLFLPTDMLTIMEDTMNHTSSLCMLFFLAYFLLTIIICNLSLTIIIEWYSSHLKDKTRDANKEDKKYDDMFKQVLSRAIARRLFSNKKEKKTADTNFHDFKLVKMSRDDHRLKFVEGIDTIKIKDLKSCQKYSNINLVDLYEKHNKKLKDLSWETDFVQLLKQSGLAETVTLPAGTVLYQQGGVCCDGFILVAGRVRVESTLFEKPLIIFSINFLGNACLDPAGRHNHTCIADSNDVECLKLTQDRIIEDTSAEISGYLLRMSFKMHHLISQNIRRVKRSSRNLTSATSSRAILGD